MSPVFILMLFRLIAQEGSDPKDYPAQKGDPQAKVRVAANVGDGQKRGQHPDAKDGQPSAQSFHRRLFSLRKTNLLLHFSQCLSSDDPSTGSPVGQDLPDVIGVSGQLCPTGPEGGEVIG